MVEATVQPGGRSLLAGLDMRHEKDCYYSTMYSYYCCYYHAHRLYWRSSGTAPCTLAGTVACRTGCCQSGLLPGSA